MASIKTMNLNHLIGQEVGTSVLLKPLATGAMSAVFIAYQKTLKRQIAVKVLPKSLLTKKTALLFQQEAEAAAILTHPNIIPIYEVGETDSFIFFTMQLVKGKSLALYIDMAKRNVLPSKRMMPLKASLTIMVHVLDALNYAHGYDIVHRDIKPGNVLIEKPGNRPIISDFGIARVSRSKSKSAKMLLGTPIYIAPEQILSGDVDKRADIYAAGVMLFEAVAAYLPYPAYKTPLDLLKAKLRLKNKLFTKRPSDMNPFANRQLDRIIFKATAFDRDARYEDCKGFADDLNTWVHRHIKHR